ncbi:MAG: hypothetical protein AB2693_16280 [Candidatus Thiodiazotropha sp.]
MKGHINSSVEIKVSKCYLLEFPETPPEFGQVCPGEQKKLSIYQSTSIFVTVIVLSDFLLTECFWRWHLGELLISTVSDNGAKTGETLLAL